MVKKAKQKHFNPQRLLQDTLHFSKDELEAMRNYVMPQQQKLLLLDIRRNARARGDLASIVLIALSVITFMVVFGTYTLFVAYPDYLSLNCVNIVSNLVLLCLVIAMIYGIIRSTRRTISAYNEYFAITSDLTRGITSVEGRIQLEVGKQNSYWLNVGELSLKLDEESFTAFRTGDPYVVYYAPESKIVLAAEWIDDVHYDQIFEDDDRD